MQCNHTPPKLSGLEQALADQAPALNDWTLQQLCEWVHAEYGFRVGVSTMWTTMARLCDCRTNTPLGSNLHELLHVPPNDSPHTGHRFLKIPENRP